MRKWSKRENVNKYAQQHWSAGPKVEIMNLPSALSACFDACIHLTSRDLGKDQALALGRKRRPSLLVGIPIAAMQRQTIFVVNALDDGSGGLDVTGPRRPNGDAAYIGACFHRGCGHNGPHDIACTKSPHTARCLGRFVGKPECIRAAHLPTMPPHGRDVQRQQVLIAYPGRRQSSHTGGIKPMGLENPLLAAIPLGASS